MRVLYEKKKFQDTVKTQEQERSNNTLLHIKEITHALKSNSAFEN